MYDDPEIPRRAPAGEVRTVAELRTLNDDEVVAGYRHGWDDPSAPIGASRSFLHGWLNAQVDKGRAQASAAQQALVREAVNSGYFRHQA